MPPRIPARRLFSRSHTPPRTQTLARSLSTTPATQGILGLSVKDLRTQKEELEAKRALAKEKGTFKPWLGNMFRTPPKPQPRHIRPPKSAAKRFSEPINHLTQLQLKALDPKGSRTRLFSRKNPEAAHVGDILLVRQRNGEPFSGVCLNVRRQGIDTAILLRNHLTRLGVEMWYKIYSPNVEGIEVVQRAQKRPRRARLYYMRQPKHDRGSVENVVAAYLKQRAALRSKSTGRSGQAGATKGKKR